MRVVAIVVGAGMGTRLGLPGAKAFVDLGGSTLLARSVAAAASVSIVERVVVVAPPGMIEEAEAEGARGAGATPVTVVAGGETRHESVNAALGAAPEDADILVVHDAARPFAVGELFEEVIAAVTGGAEGAVPVLPVADTVKRVRGDVVVSTEVRDELRLSQTPQAFAAGALRTAHARAAHAGAVFSDDAAAVEWAGYRVVVVAGRPENAKITTADDLAQARKRIERNGL